ncbi:MAG: 2-dehydropantoate 2-reductase [Chloroflexi bacterium]|nr:2-dehydropantoate 2-reductase [Chloroflexota bacterium]
MRIAIIGAGALGSLLAALLASSATENRDEIWLIGSESTQTHLDLIKTRGLRVELAPNVAATWPKEEAQTEWLIKNLAVTAVAAEAYPVDLALILVKSYRSPEAAQQAKMLLAPGKVALTLQNGLGNLAILAEGVGPERAAQGVTSLGATLLAPGVLRWSGLGPISLGITSQLNQSAQQILLEFVSRLLALNLNVITTENIDGLVWGKLIINCAINPLGALLNLPNGELLKRPSALEVMEATAREAATVAQALGILLPYPYEAAANQARLVAHQTAANINSMLADLRRGRSTEIEAINGAIVREGQRCSIPTPVNWTLTHLIKGLGH